MLTVYRASAGSGKTYQLTLEYLKLLFISDTAYRHILAVTFTNKATEEMKKRIVRELDILAHRISDSQYTETLCVYLACDDKSLLQEKARKILYTLLHDFSSFNISTIDRFFQQTTRAFTREIGLQGGYNLELDSTHVLSEAVDRMLFELENPENKELLHWLLKFSEEKVESGQYWDVRKDIGSLTGEIFKETYKSYSQDILAITADKENLKSYLRKLGELRKDFEKQSAEISKQALDLIKRSGLTPESFKGGSRSSFFWFEKWEAGEVKEPTASFIKLADTVDNWYTKATTPSVIAAIRDVYDRGLNACVNDILSCYAVFPVYITAVETSRFFYTLGILSDVDRHIQEYEKEHNVLLLSDTTELLNRIIDGSDTPFIYEKTGTRIDHFMIDEFQDTSNMQWNNFYPLFKESLDKGGANLIVGDVKQSIYRWRNSDWKLLNDELSHIFPSSQRKDALLNTNWRSCEHVVNFNNIFFPLAAAALQEKLNEQISHAPSSVYIDEQYTTKIIDAYGDVCQQISPAARELPGHVRIQFVNQDENENWQEEVLRQIPDVLRKLQDQGMPLKEIAFLVRSKEEGSLIAETLLKCKVENSDTRYRFDLISDEALYISRVPIIKLIVGILNYIQNPHDEINKILAVYEYDTSREGYSPEDAVGRYFSARESRAFSHFPEDIATDLEELRNLPLFEMCEKIISLFPDSSDSDECVFVQAFQDMVLDFMQGHSSDLTSFLAWWQESGRKKTISTPDSQDAIRILTIHKSKGLEFKTVIIPFCSWEIDHKATFNNILWCPTQGEPFDQIPLVPVKYSSRLEKTIYAGNYFNEKMHAYIDNLNLAYVAFTRAKEELFLFAPKEKNENTLFSVASLLYALVSGNSWGDKDVEYNLNLNFDPEKLLFEIGEEGHLNIKETTANKIDECPMPGYHSVSPGKRLHLRLQGKGYFGDGNERRYGTLMHEILSSIKTVDDISIALEPYVLTGQLSIAEAEEKKEYLKRKVLQVEVSNWFSTEVKVLNEIEILEEGGVVSRPDRVVFCNEKTDVIDYKFGLTERNSYIKQINCYVSQIQKMGYPSVSGYIWYVELDKIVKI